MTVESLYGLFYLATLAKQRPPVRPSKHAKARAARAMARRNDRIRKLGR